MTVSRRVPYAWTCIACHGLQQSVVWVVVHEWERPDVLAEGPLAPGFVQVVCTRCGTASAIEGQSLLLVRPGDNLPLLLGTTWADLALDEVSPAMRNLFDGAQQAMAGDKLTVHPPVVLLPRSLLGVVIARVPDDDAADPDLACGQVAVRWSVHHATLYRAFLEDVLGSARIRAVNRLLQQAWSSDSATLLQFVDAHPDFSSSDVVAAVAEEVDGGPPPGESAAPLTARLRLVQSLAAGTPPRDAVDGYLQAMWDFAEQDLNPRVEELLAQLQANPSPDLIPQARQALALSVAMGNTELEASVASDLGVRLLRLPGNRGVEEAAQLLARALELIAEEAPHWAGVAGNLAHAVAYRASGDPNENWGYACELLMRACAAEPDADPRAWATNHTNLGLLLSERPGGSDVDDLAAGIKYMQAGASRRSPDDDLIDWAHSQLNLGLLHRRRGRPGDETTAESLYREALGRLTPAVDRRLWGHLQLNLGVVLEGNGSPEAADRAIEAARAGLEAAPPLEDPELRARLLWLIARHTGDSEPARELRNQALALLVPELQPELFLNVGGEVAEAAAAAAAWDAAAGTYELLLVAFESLLDAQLTVQGRRRTLERSPRLSRWAAYALARAGRLEQAVQAIEQGRARELTLSASRGTVELDALRQVDPALAVRYENSLRVYAAMALQTDQLQEAAAARALSEAAAGLHEAVEAVRGVPGYEQFLRPLSAVDLLKAAGGLPIAYLVTAPAGSCVLTIRAGEQGRAEIGAVQVPEVTGRSVAGLVLIDVDRNLPGLLVSDQDGREAALARLGELTPLVEPVVALLRAGGAGKVVVVPTGLLGLVPLHAVPVTATRMLDDEGEIHLAPSVALYGDCRRRAARARTAHLMGVADTSLLHRLPASRLELGFVEDLFAQFESPSTRTGSSATRRWLLDEAVTASHLHLACHGSSSLDARFGAELMLGDGVITMSNLIEIRLTECRLAVVSACESGHYDTAVSPDEFLGLPGGFLQAGAACVVASLWKVNDQVAAVLMMRFYELLDPGPNSASQTPVAALRVARLWMRDLTPQAVGEFRRRHGAVLGAPDVMLDESLASRFASANSWAAFAAHGC